MICRSSPEMKPWSTFTTNPGCGKPTNFSHSPDHSASSMLSSASKFKIASREHPVSTFRGILHGEELRISRRHTDSDAANADIALFHSRLQARGWPADWIQRSSRCTKSHRLRHCKSRQAILRLPFCETVHEHQLMHGVRGLGALVRSQVLVGWKLGRNNFLCRYRGAWLYMPKSEATCG